MPEGKEASSVVFQGKTLRKRGGPVRFLRWFTSLILFLVVLLVVVYGALPAILSYYEQSGPADGYIGSNQAFYDLQIAEIFYDNYTSLSYNITAIAQSDAYGFGPGYILNGLSGAGYWYQVGISWNWSHSDYIGHFTGFRMNYEVFSPQYKSIFPSNGGGIANFSGMVNANDNIELGLHFSNGSVVMAATDTQTGAHASMSYDSFGSSIFVGSSFVNNGHTFTGLLTEWYHTDPQQTTLTPVTYTVYGSPIKAATFLVDELNFTNGTPFSTPPILQGHSGLTFFANPSHLHTISMAGISVRASGYQFIT